ncbi:hypothetical protein WP12_17795 [Sphingomonas sp. SRS2]|nr:hypothetical protein WP12_17795 [Sphingomonas sp. SRS2]
MKADGLEDGGAVRLMSCDAVERLGHDLIYPAGGDAREHGVETRPLANGAAYRIIGVDVDDFPALAQGAFPAQPDLIVDRASVLKVTAVTGVDDGLHRAFPAPGDSAVPARRQCPARRHRAQAP